MSKPFKFRYVNEIAGGFVLLVAALLVVGVMLAGHAQRWFEPRHRLTLAFPSEGSLDLQKGGEVRILGTTVGSIDEITVAEDGSMAARVTIRGDFFRFVRSDSRAIAKKKFGVAGDAYVEITKGTAAALPEGASLTCTRDTEVMEMVQQAVQQVKDVALPAIAQMQKAVEEYTNLAVDLRDPEGQLQRLLAHVNAIAAGLEKGEGTAGQILRDPALANELREITSKVNASLAEVKGILAELEDTVQIVSDEAQDLPGVVLQTRQTMQETEKLISAVQRHWLLRGYVEEEKTGGLISPSAVGGGK